MAFKTNMMLGTLVSSILAINKDLVVSLARELAADAAVLAFKKGKCVEVTGAEMSHALDSRRTG